MTAVPKALGLTISQPLAHHPFVRCPFLAMSTFCDPRARRQPHSNHQINRENGNPFFGHTSSIASFPAPVKNSVIPPESSTRSNSLTFQPFAGIWTQNVATTISLAHRIHRLL